MMFLSELADSTEMKAFRMLRAGQDVARMFTGCRLAAMGNADVSDDLNGYRLADSAGTIFMLPPFFLSGSDGWCPLCFVRLHGQSKRDTVKCLFS